MEKEKRSFTDKIFYYIMKFNSLRTYKWIHRHPKISIAILVFIAIIILYIFIGFVLKYIVV